MNVSLQAYIIPKLRSVHKQAKKTGKDGHFLFHRLAVGVCCVSLCKFSDSVLPFNNAAAGLVRSCSEPGQPPLPLAGLQERNEGEGGLAGRGRGAVALGGCPWDWGQRVVHMEDEERRDMVRCTGAPPCSLLHISPYSGSDAIQFISSVAD